ncbi:MAG TPA: hypothetical protein VF491_07255 [Vicinamibacterales bacterium]
MTIDQRVAERLEGRSPAWRLGAATTAAIGVVLTAWALSTDFVEASNNGFFGDAATYYMLGHSLADDFDFEYQRQDLVRVWEEFPGGPEGVFLKQGKGAHLFYAKSFIYPLLASPFIWLFGTNGFMVLHALLMTLSFACAYAFLAARSHPVAALIFALAFVFVSIAPIYMVQIAPDFFNFAIVLFAFFFWCYKEVAGPAQAGTERTWRTRWLLSPRSDVVAAALLGVAMFSKPTQIMLIAPLLASALLRSQWWRGFKIGAVFAAVAIGLFVVNIAVTGEWNYQGGNRKTFYGANGVNFRGGFPYQSEQNTFETIGLGREGGGLLTDVLLTQDALLEVFPHNLGYFLVGRHTGFAIYFFPGMLAVLLFLAATRDRAMWQWLTFAAGVGSAIVLLLYMPFTYSGGGGPVGNRYFLGSYGVFLFLVPPLQTAFSGLIAMGISALFVAPILSNPFYASTHPYEHSKTGLYRWLPTELTMVNDLPINNGSPARFRQPLGGTPPIFAYFLDDNVYNREGDAFWVRGESSADVLLRAPIAPESDAAGTQRATSLHITKLTAILESGPKPNRVVISTGGERRIVDMAASSQQTIELAMPHGMPYRYDPRYPTNYVYFVTISSSTGFVPMFENGANDSRFLGVMVRLIPTYGAAQ